MWHQDVEVRQLSAGLDSFQWCNIMVWPCPQTGSDWTRSRPPCSPCSTSWLLSCFGPKYFYLYQLLYLSNCLASTSQLCCRGYSNKRVEVTEQSRLKRGRCQLLLGNRKHFVQLCWPYFPSAHALCLWAEKLPESELPVNSCSFLNASLEIHLCAWYSFENSEQTETVTLTHGCFLQTGMPQQQCGYWKCYRGCVFATHGRDF